MRLCIKKRNKYEQKKKLSKIVIVNGKNKSAIMTKEILNT